LHWAAKQGTQLAVGRSKDVLQPDFIVKCLQQMSKPTIGRKVLADHWPVTDFERIPQPIDGGTVGSGYGNKQPQVISSPV
jgi:hypothetical protein